MFYPSKGSAMSRTKDTTGDAEAERMLRKSPKQKPPRYDKRRNIVREEDSDLDSDSDMSLNYKTIGGALTLLSNVLDIERYPDKRCEAPDSWTEWPGEVLDFDKEASLNPELRSRVIPVGTHYFDQVAEAVLHRMLNTAVETYPVPAYDALQPLSGDMSVAEFISWLKQSEASINGWLTAYASHVLPLTELSSNIQSRFAELEHFWFEEF
jgi:hypothetical protein